MTQALSPGRVTSKSDLPAGRLEPAKRLSSISLLLRLKGCSRKLQLERAKPYFNPFYLIFIKLYFK